MLRRFQRRASFEAHDALQFAKLEFKGYNGGLDLRPSLYACDDVVRFLESFALRDDGRPTLVPAPEDQAMLEWDCGLG